MTPDNLADFSMEELFRADAEAQCATLLDGLLSLERSADPAPLLESMMRAAHSIKGAARIVGLDAAVEVSHAMEEFFVRFQKTNSKPAPSQIDHQLHGVDLLKFIAGVVPGAPVPTAAEIAKFIEGYKAVPVSVDEEPALGGAPVEEAKADPLAAERRDIRIDSERLDILLGLAGQASVASKISGEGLRSIGGNIRKLRQILSDTASKGEDELRRTALLRQAMALSAHIQSQLSEEAEQRENQAQHIAQLNNRIYTQTLSCRMRHFGDIASGLRRMVHDISRRLGKPVDFEIIGETTEVDRDLLDRLDGPLSHLIRNALDHGMETSEERLSNGKPGNGKLILSASHRAGWLVVGVADDGRGLDRQAVISAAVRRGLVTEAAAAAMSDIEVFDFLMLPGFSLSDKVTEISGRGVGLDAVRAMAYGAGGSVRLIQRPGSGLLCEIILPISLSLVRALIVEIAGNLFALPLTHVHRTLMTPKSEIHVAAGRQHVFLDGNRVEIVSAAQVLEFGAETHSGDKLPIVVLQNPDGLIGLAVERLVGQRELSIQRLDHRLGHVQDVNSVAILDNGRPIVVLDIGDLTITATNFSSGGRYRPLSSTGGSERSAKRVLVADDSLTVRELERKLLTNRGYIVETAMDGADAWNSLRAGDYDLLVTDIDMPRMDGIELVRMIRRDHRLRDLPVVIVSYKDREEDRARGLEAGADFYLPKSSYQDESLLKAAEELIGAPESP